MSRYGFTSEADVQRYLKAQQVAQQPRTAPRRPARRLQRGTVLSGARQTATGWIMTYNDWLPKINGHQVDRYARSRLTKLGRKAFGVLVLPPMLYPQGHARVEVIRVMGPRQKPMDDDSIALLTGGIRDALKPSYIKDDSERYATFTYRNDSSRRQDGPFIEIRIDYEVSP